MTDKTSLLINPGTDIYSQDQVTTVGQLNKYYKLFDFFNGV